MRVWDVVNIYGEYVDGVAVATNIQIASKSGGYAGFTERVLGDHLSKSQDELIALAVDSFYKNEYSHKAVADYITQQDELAVKLASMEQAVDEAKRLADEAQARERLGDNKEAYINQLAQTAMDLQTLNGTVIRAVKKGSEDFTKEQSVEVAEGLYQAVFQAVDLLRNVITILE